MIRLRQKKFTLPALALILGCALALTPAPRIDAADHGDAPFLANDRGADHGPRLAHLLRLNQLADGGADSWASRSRRECIRLYLTSARLLQRFPDRVDAGAGGEFEGRIALLQHLHDEFPQR